MTKTRDRVQTKSTEGRYLDTLVRDIHTYFDMFESRLYSTKINPKTDQLYLHDAKRSFTQHYRWNAADFYNMLSNKYVIPTPNGGGE